MRHLAKMMKHNNLVIVFRSWPGLVYFKKKNKHLIYVIWLLLKECFETTQNGMTNLTQIVPCLIAWICLLFNVKELNGNCLWCRGHGLCQCDTLSSTSVSLRCTLWYVSVIAIHSMARLCHCDRLFVTSLSLRHTLYCVSVIVTNSMSLQHTVSRLCYCNTLSAMPLSFWQTLCHASVIVTHSLSRFCHCDTLCHVFSISHFI